MNPVNAEAQKALKDMNTTSNSIIGTELRTGNIVMIVRKVYIVASSSQVDKIYVREAQYIGTDRKFHSYNNADSLYLDKDNEYLIVNETELINHVKPLFKDCI